MIIDLSIDFDYFVREDPLWDFGHNETNPIFQTTIWPIRYQQHDLWRETNPEQYADVPPRLFLPELSSRGVRFYRARNLGVADSHKFALPFLLEKSTIKPADMLLHFDAHHDCYDEEEKPLDCGNWLQHYMDARPETAVTWVQPKWADLGDDIGFPSPKLKRHIDVVDLLDGLNVDRGTVRNIFLCRSGSWVPPHLDILFMQLAKDLHFHAGKMHIVEKISDRSKLFPPRELADASRQAWLDGVKKMVPR